VIIYFAVFGAIPACHKLTDKQMGGQTHYDSICHAKIAARGK